MNSWSQRFNPFIQHKLLITFMLGLMFLVPLIATAQEVTEEPQVDTVVTEEATEQPTEVVPEATVATPEPEATVEETEVFVEATEEVVIETTEEPTVEVVEPETPIVEVTPVDITSLNEDFEAWTGENWSIVDWSVAQVDESLVLFSNVAGATAQVVSLDWTTYIIEVDAKVEAGNTLSMSFDGYTLILAADGRNRLSQGSDVIATSPPIENPDDTVTWHHVSILKDGSLLGVTVDGTPQYTVATSNSPLGIFAFTATGDLGVSIDNLQMTQVDENDIQIVEIISTSTPEPETPEAVIIIDSSEVTEEPDLLAEVTEEPDLLAEVTEEPDLLAEATEEPDLLAEVTEEPDLLAEVTEEPDLLAEVTEEPAVSVVEEPVAPDYVVTNLITDDFEGDLSLWDTTASIVEVADGNHVLLVSTNGQLRPVSSTTVSGVVVAGHANILSDVDSAGRFTATFSDVYAVEISTTGVTISENGEVAVAVESAQAPSTWFGFAIEAKPEGIAVSINDIVVAEYAGTLVLDGNFSATTNTSTMFEDMTVDILTLEPLVKPLATETPDVLLEQAQNKVGGYTQAMLTAFVDGGEAAVAEFFSSSLAEQDENGRILVDILVADNYDGETIAQLVSAAGGIPTNVYKQTLEAFVDVNVIMAIAGNEGVRFIRDISRAVSTGPVGNNGLAGGSFQETWTEGYNLLSAEEWHLANIKGQDVKVGVIDTGFLGANDGGKRNGNLSCLASTTPVYTIGGLGTSVHGTEIIEVLCDMAPSANVYMFRANNAASLRDAIVAARNPSNRMDVLLITLDLGVNTSAGGGISGSVNTNVYAEIEAAKNSGMVVIAAAGNNNKRMLVLKLDPGNPGATTINIDNTSVGDVVKVGWNDFDDNGSSIATVAISVNGQSAASSSDPLVNPLSQSSNASNTVSLSIDPSSVTATTYVQIQVVPAVETSGVEFDYTSIGLGSLTTNITEDDNVGNLGRPADSDSLISVGAICYQSKHTTRWEFSSNGPRFASNGTPLSGWDATITQEEAKPSVMSYSFVSTRDQFGAPEGATITGDLVACSSGLGGTSAAAAHVAGMTALLMSNDGNSSFASMNEASATSQNTFKTVRNYLQARSVDLPLGAGANGFDTTYGAGLLILGAPTYDLTDAVNPTVEADLLPATCSTTYYVGQANMASTTINGGLLTPFTSIAAAINAATPDCVVVMPGEYVTPIFVENDYSLSPLLVTDYNDVSRADVGDVILWLRGLYYNQSDYNYSDDILQPVAYARRAGIYFGETSSDVEFSGFTFVAARFFKDGDGNSHTAAPQAVVMDGSTNTTISNSQFGKITINGVEYPGWNNLDATPILILNDAEGARVEENIFNDNSTDSVNRYPTVAVINSGISTNPTTIIGNEIFGNTATVGLINVWGSILYAEGSHIDIINNAIYDNSGETIVRIKTTSPTTSPTTNPISLPITPTHTRRARIVGNVFLNNDTVSGNAGKNVGPLINGHYAPMLYIINNTIVGNSVTKNSTFGQLIARGDENSFSNEGSLLATEGWIFWEIHNNLIYNNTYRILVGDAHVPSTTCHRIPNDSSVANLNAFGWAHTTGFNTGNDTSGTFVNRGAQNNWIVGNDSSGSGGEFGSCINAIFINKNVSPTAARFNQSIINADNQPVSSRQPLGGDDSPLARDGDFQGILTPDEILNGVIPTHTTDDWQYYALSDTYIDDSNSLLNEYSDGIDAARIRWLSDTGGGDAGDPYMDNADIAVDIFDTKRDLDVNNWEINWATYGYDPSTAPPRGVSNTVNTAEYVLDIGAFEYSPLQFEVNCVEVDCNYYDTDEEITVETIVYPAQTAGLLEDAPIVNFDFGHVVTGGFGDLTFSVEAPPNNYGAHCDSKFENTKGLVNLGGGFNEFFDYCPPRNFYTSTSNSAPDYVSFKVKVTDEAGAIAIGEIRFTIDPLDDANLPSTPVIGDDAPSAKTFEVVTTLGTTPSVRLRPYTRFNNFFFSENDNPDFESGGQLFVDYPFTYTITSVSETIPADPILIGTISEPYSASLGENPVIGLELSEVNTGSATITYDITDARGNTSTGNKLVIRSVSIIPDQGIHDDTSFVWNYSDGANAVFYTERADHNETDTPTSGDWKGERKLGAINDTLHSTSTLNDTATFRFIGTGFTLFMKGGSTAGGTFDVNIYDNDTAMLSTQLWSLQAGSTIVKRVTGVGSLVCTTQAAIDTIDTSLLRHSVDEYSITCNGLTARKHTVQVVNTGAKQLSVDAFSIINDTDLVFNDANPIPPGFHDVDNGVLRNAFNDVNWDETFSTVYSNGVAYSLVVPTPISFTITRASGFAIGTTYRNNIANNFNICVENETNGSDGICTKVEDNIGITANGIHMPFFGLDPAFDYTITLENLTAGFIFDDLVVFDELMIPDNALPLGKTLYSEFDVTFGEPFGDDWVESTDKQTIAGNRSPVGPFIAFEMDDAVDTIGISAENFGATTGPDKLAVCVNRGNIASAVSATNHFGNCVIIDTPAEMYDNVNSTTGNTVTDVGSISIADEMILIPESLFGDGWWNYGDRNTVEIFSLYPTSGFQFNSVTLFSNAAGLGEGSYTANTTGISYVEYNQSTGIYSDTTIGGGAFEEINIIACGAFKKGKCTFSYVVGSTIRTTGVGNAIVFKMKGTGLVPSFSESAGTFARVCIQEDSLISSTTPAAIATEIQDEVQANGGCEILDLSSNKSNSPRYINGLKNITQHVMIELLPSPTTANPILNFDGLRIVGGDLDGLVTLAPGQKHETSFANRKADNKFLYSGSWETKPDTNGTHSGATYDETNNDAGASISFKTSGGNVVNVTRDLKTSTSGYCTGKKKSQVCVPGVKGYSDITVCVAPEANSADRNCSVHSSGGDATQSILPISLNTTFDNSTSYIVSITASSGGFVIDAVEVLDTTTSKMTVGVYEENSSLISYENGQTDLIKNTSFEYSPLLASGNNWDWSIFGGINATISTEQKFIGSQSVKADGDTNDSIKSEAFDIVQDTNYTAVARVYVVAGTVEMRSNITGFEVQSTQFTDKWELLHYSFTASADETVQLEFAASEDTTTFFIDNVHVYKGGAWSFGSGGLNNGKIASSSGYGSQATFMFTGTGFTVKLASDASSGETQVCYDNGVDKNCFTYDDEQAPGSPAYCFGKKKKQTCVPAGPSISNNGHTVTGLSSDDYIVTIQQMDNGLKSTGSPLNSPNSGSTTVSLDHIQIYDDAKPPLLSAGTYNEDALISNEPGMQLFPPNEWEQVVGADGFTNNSYYQVKGSKVTGSLVAINVDNDPDPVTIIVDIHESNAKANQLLACANDVDGAVIFNGTGYDLTSTNCILTDKATSQTQIVFNQNDLAALDGSGGETLFSLQSLTRDSVKIDGYQVVYGTTLTDGYYEEIIGASETPGSILLLSEEDDWNSISDAGYSGLNAIQTFVSGTTVDFTFEGTGVSIIMQSPPTIQTCTNFKKGKCTSYSSTTLPHGLVSIDVTSTVCGGVCTFGTTTTDLPAIDGAITLAGLPKGTYNVTLTTTIDEVANEQVILDAIEVFGDLQELGSLYDDAQVDVNGTPLLTFGPLWTATTKDTTGKFLNNTKHSSSNIGASVSFVVSGTTSTEAILIYDGKQATSSSVEVCWSTDTLTRTCETVNLNDGQISTRVDAPAPGNYSVSVTNKATGLPLIIDAIQVVEEGLMTEGIYEDDYTGFVFSSTYVPVANANASDGSVMQLSNNQSVTFSFEGIAFSALIVESSPSFDVCAYPTGDGAECGSASALNDTGIVKTGNTVSAVSYGGFHNNDGTDNGAWTAVITNRSATPLFIDRIDILGNHNELEITDGKGYESGEPQIRYLPFGSWTEQTSFKNGTPLNGDRHQTALPGSIAYFEFNDDFGSGSVGIEYIRQIQDLYAPPPVCTKFKKGKCKSFSSVPPIPAFADANVCYGEVGDPDSMQCEPVDNDLAALYEFGSSTEIVDPSCVNGCWGFIEYQRAGVSNSITPLDYIRLYDPDATLLAGVYQENHPNINVSGTTNTPTVVNVADDDAKVGLFDRIENTVGESYFYFAFEGTGLSIRTFEGSNADDISLCIFEYSGSLPAVETALAGSTCLHTYDNVQTTDGFVTRALHGLHHDTQYMAFLKMTSDGTTVMGLDQVTVFDKQWFDENDLSDSTYLHQLTGGNSYPINFKTRNSDKLVQFIGNWQTVSQSYFIRYTDPKKKTGPIFGTIEGDRALETGATALFRVSGSNAVNVDIELGKEGSFQICAIPMTPGAPFEVDITQGATCQTFTQNGRTNASMVFSDDLSPYVITVELLSDTWMSLYSVSLYDILNGLGEGLYDQSTPAIQYDTSFNMIIDEDMEETDIDWAPIGTPETNERSGFITVCVKFKKGKCKGYGSSPEAYFEGKHSRKLIANIGQGIQYDGSGSGVSLEDDTFYTAIAHVYIDPTAAGGVAMRLVSGTDTIDEVIGLDLSTTTRGSWQTIRADFHTTQAYPELMLQIVATDGQAKFFVDDVTLTTGGQWTNATPPSGLFAYGGDMYQSSTPGASFTFDFIGTGFELGLIDGNQAGEVEVCYHPESNSSDVNCFTYSQYDDVVPVKTVCTSFKKKKCNAFTTIVNKLASSNGRTIVGLPNDTWTVVVRDMDDGYTVKSSTTSRDMSAFTFGLDYVNIFEDTDVVTVPPGSYNEDAQDGSNNDYIALYPEDRWQSFAGSSAFSKKTYVAPSFNSQPSTIPGSAAMLKINVASDDEDTAVLFQFGGSTSGFAQTLLVCVDETNGKMEWNGTQFSLVDSSNCKLFSDVGSSDQVSITSDDIAELGVIGTHNITISALSTGLFRIDQYQVFNSRALAAGLHSETLPSTILSFEPGSLNLTSTCDPLNEWCFKKTKTISTTGCIQFKKGKCKKTGTIVKQTSPYLGSAAITSKNGAIANFVIKGTGFSIISDVANNGLDFRVCYKLESSGTAFPALDSGDEILALNGYDGDGLPVLISEGGILCEDLTTDTDNWDAVMDRPLSSGEQYGFSFYGLPFTTYEVQVMVTTPQVEISSSEWFTLDAISVFSDFSELSAIQPGLVDDTNVNISYEPIAFWDSNSTSNTYENTDSTTNHAGAISQFRVNGNTLVLYQTVGNMSPDVQICLLISNENIHCSVEAERQSRLARQVMSFTQQGGKLTVTVCVKSKKGKCKAYGNVLVSETLPFTPIVFYGLGQDTEHTIIMENRVQGMKFNIDAIRVRD